MGITSKNGFFLTELDHSNQLGRADLHGEGDRTAAGAVAALVALGQILAAFARDKLNEFPADLPGSQRDLHMPSSKALRRSDISR
jgi:hypothetical protein